MSCPSCETAIEPLGIDEFDGICPNCGLVMDEGSWPSSFAVDTSSSGNANDSSSQGTPWVDDVQILDATDQQLVRVVSRTDEVADKLGLSVEGRHRAVEIAIEAWEQNIMHGREFDATVAAGVYLAAHQFDNPRPTHVVASHAGTTTQQFARVRKAMVQELELESESSDPEKYLPYLCDMVQAPSWVQLQATDRLENTRMTGNPVGIAAAALYLTAKDELDLTLKDAAEIAGVTKETIWKKSKELREITG